MQPRLSRTDATSHIPGFVCLANIPTTSNSTDPVIKVNQLEQTEFAHFPQPQEGVHFPEGVTSPLMHVVYSTIQQTQGAFNFLMFLIKVSARCAAGRQFCSVTRDAPYNEHFSSVSCKI